MSLHTSLLSILKCQETYTLQRHRGEFDLLLQHTHVRVLLFADVGKRPLLHKNINVVTMPTCDVLLRHFRKTYLYTQGYAVAQSYLLCTYS